MGLTEDSHCWTAYGCIMLCSTQWVLVAFMSTKPGPGRWLSDDEECAAFSDEDPRLKPYVASAEGYVLIDDTGTMLWYNRAICDFFQYDPEELSECNVRKLMPQVYAQQHDRFVRSYIETGEGKVVNNERIVPCLLKDSSTKLSSLLVTEKLWADEDSQRRYFLGRLTINAQLDQLMDNIKQLVCGNPCHLRNEMPTPIPIGRSL